MLLSFGGSIEYFCDAVFNHPTIAESYKVAAFDGLNRLCTAVPVHRTATAKQQDKADAPVATFNAESVRETQTAIPDDLTLTTYISAAANYSH